MVTAALIAATHIQQLVHARDGGPGPLRPCTDVFAPEDPPCSYSAKLRQRRSNWPSPDTTENPDPP